MKTRDIRDAIEAGDFEIMRRAFRDLVNPTGHGITASSPGLLVVSLNRLCAALETDSTTMPSEACAHLDLPAGSSYGAGAARARRDSAKLARQLVSA